MTTSKLGRYITSREFSERVAEVVEDAVRDLEQRGFTPVYDRSDDQPAVKPKPSPPTN